MKKTVDDIITLVKRLVCNVKTRTSFQVKSRAKDENKVTFQVVLLVLDLILHHIL